MAETPTARESVPGLLTDYLVSEEDRRSLKWSVVVALLVHFALFLVVLPERRLEPIRITGRSAAIVVKRYKPPAPPARPKKTVRRRANPVPIPDPTPDEPEPIQPEQAEFDFGDPEAEFAVGLPEAPPGPGGARAGAYRMGEGGVIPPVPIRQVLPEYTPEATRAGIQGEVYIEAVINVEGTVEEPVLIRGLPDEELNRRAIEAILKWRFRPGLKDGQPVPVIAMFTVQFRIH